MINNIKIEGIINSSIFYNPKKDLSRFLLNCHTKVYNHNTYRYYDRQDCVWITCWGDLSHIAHKKLTICDKVVIEGLLRHRRKYINNTWHNYYSIEAKDIIYRKAVDNTYRDIVTGRFANVSR